MEVTCCKSLVNAYRTNPLTYPLRKLNAKIGLLCEGLPKDKRAWEIAKRIALVIMAVVLYAVFIPLAAIGVAIGMCLKTRKVEGQVNIHMELDRMKEKILSTIGDVEGLKYMRSAKVTINVECGNKMHTEKCIIKKTGDAQFTLSYLSQEMDGVLAKLEKSLNLKARNNISIKWGILIKDKEDETYFAHGLRHAYFDKGKYQVENQGSCEQNIEDADGHLQAIAVDG